MISQGAVKSNKKSKNDSIKTEGWGGGVSAFVSQALFVCEIGKFFKKCFSSSSIKPLQNGEKVI